jgi:predicted Zn finger-like uncharacterized protein
VIEIVCPNCQARYQLPDGAIGPEGRKVSCSSCAHKWRAHPEEPDPAEAPAAAGQPAPEATPAVVTPPPEAAPAAPAASKPAPAEPEAAESEADPDDDEDVSAPPANLPPPATGNRDEQMAAIRKMLSDLKDAADTGSDSSDGAAAGAAAAAAASVGPSAKRREDDAPNRNRLEDRIDDVDKLAKMVKGEPTGDGYDATRLRKRHEKRAKRMQRARERRKKSGAFVTGFTLVALVAAVMVGLYVMHPQIIAASPELEPALTQYVNTVDRYRVEFAATTDEWKAWLSERIGNLQKKADE